MSKAQIIVRYEKTPKKKKPWRSLVGNLLLSNSIALIVVLIRLSCGEGPDWKLNFLINNAVGLIVWLFSIFFPWE